jgi:hypothetical protein
LTLQSGSSKLLQNTPIRTGLHSFTILKFIT